MCERIIIYERCLKYLVLEDFVCGVSQKNCKQVSHQRAQTVAEGTSVVSVIPANEIRNIGAKKL